MVVFTIKLIWDEGLWHTEADEVLGLTLEAESFDLLVERVKVAVPEMAELNCGYVGDIQISFENRKAGEQLYEC